MSISVLTFYIFAVVILGSAVMVVTRRNAVTSALFLALTLIAVAGLYVSLHAEFLFAVQILVYTGGVMVLFLFVIMLVNVDEMVSVRPVVKRWALPIAFTAFSFAVLAAFASKAETGRLEAWDLTSNTKAVALRLFTDYLLPFEIVSILLLVAMVGAIVLAKKEV